MDHVPISFWGRVSGSEDRGGSDSSIQFIKFGRESDKSFKEWRQKIGGGRVGDNSILTFLFILTRICLFISSKKLAARPLGARKFRNS